MSTKSCKFFWKSNNNTNTNINTQININTNTNSNSNTNTDSNANGNASIISIPMQACVSLMVLLQSRPRKCSLLILLRNSTFLHSLGQKNWRFLFSTRTCFCSSVEKSRSRGLARYARLSPLERLFSTLLEKHELVEKRKRSVFYPRAGERSCFCSINRIY